MSSDTHVYQTAGDYLIQAIATSLAGSFSAMLNNDAYPALDTTFGSAGTVSGVTGSITSWPSTGRLDGGGPKWDRFATCLIAAAFTGSGQPDGTTFDDISACIPTITAVAVQPVTGGFGILAAGSGYRVARLNSDGSLDTTFGGDGIASPSSPLPTGEGAGEGVQMFVEPDGDIVLAGIEPDIGGGGVDDPGPRPVHAQWPA